MKSTFPMQAALLATAFANADTVLLTGRVLEKALQSPVAGAKIQLTGGTATATTDATGHFRLAGNSTGIQLPGGETRNIRVDNGRVRIGGLDGDAVRAEWIDLSGRSTAQAPASAEKGTVVLDFPPHDFVGTLRLTTRGQVQTYRAVRFEGGTGSLSPIAASGERGVAAPAYASRSGSVGEITVSMDRLVSKAVPTNTLNGDLGDIVLDYPPRRIDTGAPPIYGSIQLVPGGVDSTALRAAIDSQWIHVDTYWRQSQGLKTTPVTWKIFTDPVSPTPYKATLSPCCMPRNGSQNWGYDDIVTKRKFKDVELHVEFNMMGDPDGNASSTGYSNSGVMFTCGDWMELQIETPPDPTKPTTPHDMASLLDHEMPSAYPWRGAGKWQAYDITLKRPYGGASGKVTVYWNGILVHDNSNWGATSYDSCGLSLQNEDGSDVRYRNIWIKELNITDDKTNFGY